MKCIVSCSVPIIAVIASKSTTVKLFTVFFRSTARPVSHSPATTIRTIIRMRFWKWWQCRPQYTASFGRWYLLFPASPLFLSLSSATTARVTTTVVSCSFLRSKGDWPRLPCALRRSRANRATRRSWSRRSTAPRRPTTWTKSCFSPISILTVSRIPADVENIVINNNIY